MKLSGFPKIKVIPIKNILIHEKTDQVRGKRLLNKIKKDKVLRHPIIVTKLPKNKYLQLDGVNRICALKLLGCPDILAQIVDYNREVKLECWSHLTKVFKKSFLKKIDQIKDVSLLKLSPQVLELAQKNENFLCCFFFKDKDSYFLTTKVGFHKKMDILCRIVDLYKKKIERKALSSLNLLEEQKNFWPTLSENNLLISFREFVPAEIIKIAKENILLPPGITRHLVFNRVLEVNYPLALLNLKLSLEVKNRKLLNHLNQKKARVYEEPTIIFEE